MSTTYDRLGIDDKTALRCTLTSILLYTNA